MTTKIPKFKARPQNKKILETPTLPTVPRSTPWPPEFQEFHLETMARANQNAETSTVAPVDSSQLSMEATSDSTKITSSPNINESMPTYDKEFWWTGKRRTRKDSQVQRKAFEQEAVNQFGTSAWQTYSQKHCSLAFSFADRGKVGGECEKTG